MTLGMLAFSRELRKGWRGKKNNPDEGQARAIENYDAKRRSASGRDFLIPARSMETQLGRFACSRLQSFSSNS
jgi:hypothetical protein